MTKNRRQVDQDQFRSLQEFRAECRRSGLIETYSSLGQFRESFGRHLQNVISEFEPPTDNEEIEITSPSLPVFLPQALQLLMKATAEDSDGVVLTPSEMDGFSVTTNHRVLVENARGRLEARWTEAISQLVKLGMMDPIGYKREIFKISQRGYETADRIRNESPGL